MYVFQFFFNEAANDFPLYTEGLQFFNHPESMVRIAVRTLTLNVFRCDDKVCVSSCLPVCLVASALFL